MNDMGKYRKKPVIIEAIQWNGRDFNGIQNFCPDIIDMGADHSDSRVTSWPLAIKTMEGTVMAIIGDWIIKGVNGEFYLCKPDIFEKTYEPA